MNYWGRGPGIPPQYLYSPEIDVYVGLYTPRSQRNGHVRPSRIFFKVQDCLKKKLTKNQHNSMICVKNMQIDILYFYDSICQRSYNINWARLLGNIVGKLYYLKFNKVALDPLAGRSKMQLGKKLKYCFLHRTIFLEEFSFWKIRECQDR